MTHKALLVTRDGLTCYVDDVPIGSIMSRVLRRPLKSRWGLDPFDPKNDLMPIAIRNYETTRPDPGGVTIFHET